MNTEQTEEQFIANCRINEIANLSPTIFLNKLQHIKYIRVQPLRAFTIRPVSEEDWIALDRFHALVNKGDFGPDANFTYERPLGKKLSDNLSSILSNHWRIFGVYVPNDLFYWFRNNSLHIIKKQIILFSAATYYIENEVPDDLAPPLLGEINRIIQKYFSGEDIHDYQVYSKVYNTAALDYFHSQMPPFLPSLGNDFNEDIFVLAAFFSPDDWNRFILHKVTKWYKWNYFDERHGRKPSEDESGNLVEIPAQLLNEVVYADNLYRSETDQETWSKWRMTFNRYPMNKSHVFSLFGDELTPGYIYVFRSGLSNRYKIGFTKGKDVEKGRKPGLQTGSPEPLILIDVFPASGIKTEKTIHDIFSKNRISGEWFELTDEELLNLCSPEWRRRKNIF